MAKTKQLNDKMKAKKENVDQFKNRLSPQLCTRIVATRSQHDKELWKIENHAFHALMEPDAGVVIIIKKGTTVTEANLVLWSVAQQLIKLEKKHRKNRKKVEGVVSDMKAKQPATVKRLIVLAVKLFYLPTKLVKIIWLGLNKKTRGGW